MHGEVVGRSWQAGQVGWVVVVAGWRGGAVGAWYEKRCVCGEV